MAVPYLPLDELLKILDRFTDLLKIKGKRYQRRFDEIWKPTYEDLQVVHENYLRMFRQVSSFFEDAVKGADREKTYAEARMEALKFIKAERVKLAPVRQKLHAFDGIDEITKGLADEEINFLHKVRRYMGMRSFPDKIGSASVTVQTELERLAEMDEKVASDFLSRITDMNTYLAEDWTAVSSAYKQLQFALIRSST